MKVTIEFDIPRIPGTCDNCYFNLMKSFDHGHTHSQLCMFTQKGDMFCENKHEMALANKEMLVFCPFNKYRRL